MHETRIWISTGPHEKVGRTGQGMEEAVKEGETGLKDEQEEGNKWARTINLGK